jgi:hypothetical protein
MPNIPNSSPPPNVPPVGKSKKLLDQYSEFLRNRHYSLRTEKTYISWVRQYILYHHIRTIQKLLRHKDVKTTMIYTHALRVQRGGLAVKRPLDT